MAKRKKARKAAAKPLTAAKKKRFMKKLGDAAAGLKTLTATVKALRAQAVSDNFVGGAPMAARARRRRKRG